MLPVQIYDMLKIDADSGCPDAVSKHLTKHTLAG